MQEKILDFLKRNKEYVSGEEISESLKVSRQALWKHIQALRDSGFEIEAVPHLGYQLQSSPDRLFPSEIKHNLGTKFIGRSIYYFDSLSSTMDTAMQLAIKAAQEGTIILAEAQNHGRGRLGRGWSSPKYKGIYLSLILRPKIPPNASAILTLLCAVSICEAIKEATALEPQIKWPNDILIENKKLGGILTELSAETDAVRFLIIGIGLNVNNDKKSLLPQATSLKEVSGAAINRISLLQEVLRSIEKNYLLFQKQGAKFVTDKWRNYAVTLNRRVKIISHHSHIEGEALDIDSDGSLLVRKDSGIVQKVFAGDLIYCR